MFQVRRVAVAEEAFAGDQRAGVGPGGERARRGLDGGGCGCAGTVTACSR